VPAHAVRELITQRPKIKEAHALGALLSIDTLWVALCPAECGTSLRAIASRTLTAMPPIPARRHNIPPCPLIQAHGHAPWPFRLLLAHPNSRSMVGFNFLPEQHFDLCI